MLRARYVSLGISLRQNMALCPRLELGERYRCSINPPGRFAGLLQPASGRLNFPSMYGVLIDHGLNLIVVSRDSFYFHCTYSTGLVHFLQIVYNYAKKYALITVYIARKEFWNLTFFGHYFVLKSIHNFIQELK